MKILITILLALFISSNASADTRILEKISVRDFSGTKSGAQLVCIDGYKWIYILTEYTQSNQKHITNTMNQFMIEKDGRTVPAKC